MEKQVILMEKTIILSDFWKMLPKDGLETPLRRGETKKKTI